MSKKFSYLDGIIKVIDNLFKPSDKFDAKNSYLLISSAHTESVISEIIYQYNNLILL